jgi:hypothetical protein
MDRPHTPLQLILLRRDASGFLDRRDRPLRVTGRHRRQLRLIGRQSNPPRLIPRRLKSFGALE